MISSKVNNLLGFCGSHKVHGTKLANLVSKLNELATRDGGGPGAQNSCRHLVAAEWAEGDVLIGYGCGSGCAYWGSALTITISTVCVFLECWLIGNANGCRLMLGRAIGVLVFQDRGA